MSTRIPYDQARDDPEAAAKLADGRFVVFLGEEGRVYVFEYETTRAQRQQEWADRRAAGVAYCRELGIEPPAFFLTPPHKESADG